MKRTIIAVKLRASRTTKELGQLSLILLCLAGIIGLMALVKIVPCKKAHPEKDALSCLRHRHVSQRAERATPSR